MESMNLLERNGQSLTCRDVVIVGTLGYILSAEENPLENFIKLILLIVNASIANDIKDS